MMKIVYIAGYGRSGSTILEGILNLHPQIMGLGELSYFPGLLNKLESKCACGNSLAECPFWASIFQEFISKMVYLSEDIFYLCKQMEGIGIWGPFGLLSGDSPSILHRILKQGKFRFNFSITKNYVENYNRYKYIQKEIFQIIKKHLSYKIRYIIDSSKTAYTAAKRPYLLSKIGINMKVIHLVRDVRGVMWSTIKRGLSQEIGREDKGSWWLGIRALIGWLVANKYAENLKKILSYKNYLLIRYEDFVITPKTILNKIGEFIEIDLTNVINMLNDKSVILQESHQIAGNRVRAQREIRIKPDFIWEKEMPLIYQKIALVGVYSFLKKYGYER